MTQLPVLSGAAVVEAFKNFGWRLCGQSDSHFVLIKAGETISLSVPNQSEISKGTLRSLLRAANLPVDEFAGAV